jgi:hypothetical protein
MSILYRATPRIKSTRPLLCVRKPRPTPADRWPAWTDQIVCTIDHAAPELVDDSPERLDLGGIIDREIARFRSWNSEVGDLLAGELQTIRREVELCHAETVAQLEDRREALMAGVA